MDFKLQRRKECPLCGATRWPDGAIRLEEQELSRFEFHGFNLEQIREGLNYAIERGWDPQKKQSGENT